MTMRFFPALSGAPRCPRFFLAGAALAVLTVLAGCAGSPSGSISLPLDPPPAATDTRAAGLAVEKIQWQGARPGCEGQCPRIEIDSVAFPDMPKLTELIDHGLAYMTGVDPGRPHPYRTLSEYVPYFWQTAQSRDVTVFKASVKAVVGDIVAVELHTNQTLTGAAHDIPATQYLNWQRGQARVLALDEALQPGAHAAFVEALRRAHATWLARNEEAQHDPQAYRRMWPFQESHNFALTPEGMVIKYDAYSIAPYSHGEPELRIPYAELRGILRPEFLPAT